jgi:hypothetical protein
VLALASPVLAARVVTDPEPDRACPAEHGSGVLTWYATTVDTPADSTTWQVSVEFTVEGGTCEFSLASYELAAPTFTLPQEVFDSETGTFGPGTHVLTAALPRQGDLPGCWSQYDFVFGPVITTLTESERYGDRQIRSRIVGSETCEITITETPTPTPTPTQVVSPGTPTPTPEDDVQGGTGTPAPDVPDTAVSASASGSSPLVPVVAVVFLISLGTFATLARVRARNR